MQTETLPGLTLTEDHALLISQGQKSGFVKSEALKKHCGDEVFVVADGKVYAKITFAEPRKITLAQFKSMFVRHKISEEQRKSWWKGKRILYFYKILSYRGFVPPLDTEYKKPKGVFVDAVSVELEGVLKSAVEDPTDRFERSFTASRSVVGDEPRHPLMRTLDDFIPDMDPDEVLDIVDHRIDGTSRRREETRREEPRQGDRLFERLPTDAPGMKGRLARMRKKTRGNRTTIQEPQSVKDIKKQNPASGLMDRFKKKMEGK